MIPAFDRTDGSGRRTSLHGVLTRMRSFVKDESGVMSYVAVVGALTLMIFGGMGIDLISTELKRNKIQNTLDRAVLAAADLDQTLDPEAVVTDYMAKMNLSDTLTSVTLDRGLNHKTVTADASVDAPANFLRLLGIDSLRVEGLAQAEERIAKVEISMVLDISGSMRDNNKLERLQTAANTFIDTVLDGNSHDMISVSLVPYSEQVNAGPLLTQHLNVYWMHGYSHCLEFPNSEFGSTALDTTLRHEQVQHFQWNNSSTNSRTDTVCPRNTYERISPFSQDAVALKAQVAQLRPRAGTSIFLGMKWGTALLDPSTRGIADALIGSGNVETAFRGRPANFDDVETLKTVVLMTDGQNDRSYRLQSWAYDSESEIAQWDQYNLWYYLDRNVPNNLNSSYYTPSPAEAEFDGLTAGLGTIQLCL